MSIFIRLKVFLVAVLAICIMGQLGCLYTPFEPTTGSVKVKNIKVNESFVITLKSNPTTGYSWNADFDENFLSLVLQEYVPDNENLVGSGGVEKFTFTGLEAGTTAITMNYKRPWEEESIETQIFTVNIE